MSDIASLIREFPFGSFLIILSAIGACASVATSFVNRNKPVYDCRRVNNDLDDAAEDDDVGEEVETEVKD